MIMHSVIFSFKQSVGEKQQKDFFAAAADLAEIPGVKNFELLKQVSVKNNYDYGISMQFGDQASYDNYNNHNAHQLFISDYWIPCIEKFLEIDFERM